MWFDEPWVLVEEWVLVDNRFWVEEWGQQ